MKKSILFATLAALLVLDLPAGATEGGTLDVRQAIDIALGGNVDLAQGENVVLAGEVAVKRSKTVFLPTLQASLGTNLQVGRQFDQVAGEYRGAIGGSLSLGLHLDLMIFDGLAGVANMRSAKMSLEASRLELTRAQQTIIHQTVVAYVALLVDQELIEVYEENAATQEQLLGMVEAQKEAGHAIMADVFKQKAELESARLAVLTASSQLDMDRIELERVLGLEPGSVTGVVPLDVVPGASEYSGMDVAVAVTLAMADRPDVKSVHKEIGAAKEQVKAAYSGYMPRIGLSAQAGTSWSSFMSEHYGFAEQMFQNNIGAVFGLSVVIPIFDGLVTKYDVEAAKISVVSRELDLEGVEQQVVVEVYQAFEDHEKALVQLEVATRQLEYAEQSLAAYEETYVSGGCTLVDVSQAKALHMQAQHDVVQATYGLLVGELDIAYSIGDGDAMLMIASG